MVALLVAAALAGEVAHAATPRTVPRDTDPWWAPQGTTIAFQREAPGLDGADVFFTPVARGRETDIIGTGRPRGFRPGSGELLVETGSSTSMRDGSNHQLATIPGTDATWSPDGTKIAFLQGDALMVSAANGADARKLAEDIVPPRSDVTGPIWSPDGSAIAIATTSTAGSSLEVVPLDGSEPRVAFDGAGDNVNPSWSHDGSTLAFERNQGARWEIWLVAPDGSDTRQISGGPNNRFPQWSPTDGRLAFLSDRGGGYALYVGAPEAAPQELIGAVTPDSPARWALDGKALAVASAAECGRFGIYTVSASPPLRKVRRSNQCRIDGTPGFDLIYGTPYYELIDGGGGSDRLFAGNGNDIVYGRTGNDAIGGGPGNDVIYGGPGDDILSGSIGNDVIYGGPGLDKIGCGPGNDTAHIGPGDTVRDCEHVDRSR